MQLSTTVHDPEDTAMVTGDGGGVVGEGGIGGGEGGHVYDTELLGPLPHWKIVPAAGRSVAALVLAYAWRPRWFMHVPTTTPLDEVQKSQPESVYRRMIRAPSARTK